MYRSLIGSVVADSLARAVPPVAAFDSARAHKVPRVSSHSRERVCFHHLVVTFGERHW